MVNRERYTKDAHAILDLQYHFMWKTKYSYNVLNGNIALRLRDLIKEMCAVQGILVVKGTDLIMCMIKAPSDLSPAKMAQYLKGRTAHTLIKRIFGT
jgi:putative transposase